MSNPLKENDRHIGRDPDATDPGDACPPQYTRDTWHGTHVAGTIGSVYSGNSLGVAGVAPHVKILPVRVLGKCGGDSIDIITAVRWAADLLSQSQLNALNLPRVEEKANIINMSLGGPGICAPAYENLFSQIRDSGTLVVVAAGNASDDAGSFFPASCRSVFTVAASDSEGNLAYYSNFGASVDLLAPGGDLSSDRNGDGYLDGVFSIIRDGYALKHGTSMAAPHVSGLAAILLGLDDRLTPAELAAYMQQFSVARSDANCPRDCGAGLLSGAFLLSE